MSKHRIHEASSSSSKRTKNLLKNKLAYLAYHDELTGLANRTNLREKLKEMINEADTSNTHLAVLFIDLDRFKNFNDTLGHLEGDLLLSLVAKRLKNSVRKKDFLARVGGDEFVLVIPNIRNSQTVHEIVKKIMKAFVEPFSFDRQAYFLETSIGSSIYPKDGIDNHTLLKNADSALSIAKEMGGNNHQVFTPTILDKKKKALEIEQALRNALDKNEFIIYYQPIFHVPSNTLYGFESLIRWKFKNTILGPGHFISVAEKRNLILPMGEWLLKTTCESLTEWRKKFPNFIFNMSINISSKQLCREVNFLSAVKEILKKTQTDPKLLIFEIMEGSLMDDIKSSASLIKEIKKLGIQIGIDDFGTGYSSLNYIKYFSADCIKIDKSFIAHIEDAHNRTIIQHVISMARSLHIKTIAEGVETQVQYDLLKKMKVDMVQGYLLGRPMPIKHAAALLDKMSKKN